MDPREAVYTRMGMCRAKDKVEYSELQGRLPLCRLSLLVNEGWRVELSEKVPSQTMCDIRIIFVVRLFSAWTLFHDFLLLLFSNIFTSMLIFEY